MQTCPHCSIPFRTDHEKKRHEMVLSCKDFRQTHFLCGGCKFRTKSLAIIEKHNQTCVVPESEWSEDPYAELLERIRHLEGYVENKQLPDGYAGLVERIKKLEVALPSFSQEIYVETPPPERKKTFRPIKTELVSQEENENDKMDRIQKVDEELTVLREKFGDYEACMEEIAKSFDSLEKSRVYVAQVKRIKKMRCSLIGVVPPTDYKALVREHITKFSELFKAREFNDTKIVRCISNGLSPLEARVLRYGKYYETCIEMDDVNNFRTSLTLSVVSPQKYTPYDSELFNLKMLNYGLVMFPIAEVFECFVTNTYGFHNVVYVAMPSSTDDDPYSFYTLEGVSKNQLREWRLNSRLVPLLDRLRDNVLPYMISTFRNIYYDIFDDNEYRVGYANSNHLLEIEGHQLLINILDMSIPRLVCGIFREIVKRKCTHIATDLDRFNCKGDDVGQRRKMSSSKDDPDIMETVNSLFDNISTKDALDFYSDTTRK